MGAFNLPGRSGNGHPKRAPERIPSHGAHASTPGAHNGVSRWLGGAGSLPRISNTEQQLISRKAGLADKPRSNCGAHRETKGRAKSAPRDFVREGRKG
ncbi:hypothetical protein ABIB66_004015 [Bradyrhizobium sp. F1.13.3]